MKKSFAIGIIMLTCLLSTNRIDAETKDISAQITLANELYHEKNYQDAADIFIKLIDQGVKNGYLYYNLGNTYIRLGNISSSIVYYLRAKQLIPRNANLEANLRYAISQTQDQLSPPKKRLITDILFWIESINLIEHCIILFFTNIIFWLICIGSLYYRKSTWHSMKKVALTVLLIVFLSTLIKNHLLLNQKIGVVTDKIVAIKSDRNNKNITLFKLHEGAIILINEEDKEWLNVSVESEKTGWVAKNSIGY